MSSPGPTIRHRRAFPEQQPDMNHKGDAPGMTLRQYYAGQAMTGLLATRDADNWSAVGMAQMAVEYADALCEELAK